jgi:UDP-glucose 4-epimerase
MTRYLVTGGCGFIGSHLVKTLLQQGHDVRVFDNLTTGRTQNLDPDAELIFGDVANPVAIGAALRNTDGCFHLAGAPPEAGEWLDSHHSNLTGTVTVLDAARRDKLPVVYASSSSVYGDSAEAKLAEGLPVRPLTRRGADAASCELQARIAATDGVPNAGLRLFHVYGPRRDTDHPQAGVVAQFAACLRAGAPLILHGDGGQSRDFVFIADAVALLLAAMQRLEQRGIALAEVFNLCSGRPTRIRDLAQTMAGIAGLVPDLQLATPRRNDPRRVVGDPDLAERSLGVRAETSLEDGLRQVLAAPSEAPAGRTAALTARG